MLKSIFLEKCFSWNICTERLWGGADLYWHILKCFKFWWKEHYCNGTYFDEKVNLCFRYCSKTRWKFIKTCIGRKWTYFKDMCRHGCKYCCLFPEGLTELPLTLMGKMLFAFHLVQEWVLFSSLKTIKYLLELQMING